jgi:hypothetical protein
MLDFRIKMLSRRNLKPINQSNHCYLYMIYVLPFSMAHEFALERANGTYFLALISAL